MKFTLLIFLFGLLAISQAYDYKTDCLCPTWDGSYPDSKYVPKPMKSDFQLSGTTETIDGVDYGKSIYFANRVWLGKDVQANPDVRSPVTSCPSGYRVPNGDEIRMLLQAVQNKASSNTTDFFIKSFNMSVKFFYVTTEKGYPGNFNGNDNDAWVYTTFYFKNELSPIIENYSIYWIDRSVLRARCVLDTSLTINRNFIENITYPLNKDQATKLKYVRDNTLANVWKVNNVIIGTKKQINWSPSYAGCHVLESFLKVFGEFSLRQCQIVWAELPFGSSKDTILSVSSIKNTTFTDKSVNMVNSMHLNPSTAPIAPKADGGAYALMATKDTLDLFVRVLDNNGVDVRAPIALNKTGYPFDIISTPWGFVCLIKDKADFNFLYMLGINENGSVKFFRTIMNNGLDPNTAKDQINFYNSKNGDEVSGFDAIYRPYNGKLAYFRGRINVIFSHYNHFGWTDSGSRNDHQGDSVITFDDNGSDEKLVFTWGASHSLIQNLVTTDYKVIGASLSDAYPNNIRFITFGTEPNDEVDPVKGVRNRIDYVGLELISGRIVGNGGGSSCGTLGSLIYLGNEILAATFQRKGCNSGSNSEVGVVFFYSNLTKIKEVSLIDGTNVNVLKSAKYGNNILIAMGNTRPSPDQYPYRHIDYSNDVMTLMLISPGGTILAQSTTVTPYSMTSNDDFEVLSNGTVVWGFIDMSNHFVFCRLQIKLTAAFVQKKLRHKNKNKLNVLNDRV